MARQRFGHVNVKLLQATTSLISSAPPAPTFEQIYAETFRVVWHTVRRMGVVNTAVDDVVQDVFTVVHQKLAQVTGVRAIRSWVLAITTRVVQNYRRAWRRKGAGYALATTVEDPDLISDASQDPYEQVSRAEAVALAQRLLDGMDSRKSSIFVSVEIEGLSVAEIARARDLNAQTIYSRLSAARRDFEQGMRRFQQCDAAS